MQKLDPAHARELLASLPHRRHDEDRGAITREFCFADFAQAIAFMTQIALVAARSSPTTRSSPAARVDTSTKSVGSHEMTEQRRTAMITGAAGNLGRCVAASFHASGANLVLVELRRENLAQAAGAEDERRQFAPIDLLDQAQVHDAAKAAVDRFGRIDVLCNLAGGFRMGEAVHETADANWDFLFDLNARTLLHAVRAVVPGMIERGGGKIVNVGAFSAQKGQALMGRVRRRQGRGDAPDRIDGGRVAREEHQRQLRAADDHRHAGESRCDAARRARTLGGAGRLGQRDRLPGIGQCARDPWRRAAGDGAELNLAPP